MSMRRKEEINRGSFIVGDEQSFQNLYQDNGEVARIFGRMAHKIVTHKNFNSQHFQDYDLYLSEAYCLLWQNAETGEVSGRKLGIPLKIGTFAALFIDLVAAQRLEIFEKDHGAEPMFRVTDLGATDPFLEEAIFDCMRHQKMRRKLREATLMDWLGRAEEADCVDNTFDNLVHRGILREQTTGILGTCKRFPTLEPRHEAELVEKIKEIAFEHKAPDSFMEALLVLCRESDKIFVLSDPLLKKHFPKDEYQTAKANLDRLFRSYKV